MEQIGIGMALAGFTGMLIVIGNGFMNTMG